MDAENTDVYSVKTEIKLEELDEPEELHYSEVKKRFEINGGQLIEYPIESTIFYKSEHLKFEETDIKSEIYSIPDTLSVADYSKHKCEICGYQTHNKSNLNQHLAHHQYEEKIPEHECNECGFKTLHSSSLKRHLHHHRKSNKLKLYLYKPSIENVECPNCNYQTNDRSNLRRHNSPLCT